MTSRFLQTVFTDSVKAQQEAFGSRKAYSGHDDIPTERDRLGELERAFIAGRDSFYLATVSETGWPHVQHRGGPAGFVKTIDDQTLGFADFRGNRQYVSVGNLAINDRVALIFMDYPGRNRLKVLGRVRNVPAQEQPDLAAQFQHPLYKAVTERVLLIDVEAFDWNCSQHITPRFSKMEVTQVVAPLKARIRELEEQLAQRS